jgi:hypothetical protein
MEQCPVCKINTLSTTDPNLAAMFGYETALRQVVCSYACFEKAHSVDLTDLFPEAQNDSSTFEPTKSTRSA